MNDSPKIKNIIFDLSEVLLTGIRDTGLALGEKHKLDSVNNKVGWTPIGTPLLVPLVAEFFHGNISEDEYIDSVLNKYPMLGNRESLKKHIRENFREVEGTREIILKLKKLGYTLALLSVHAREWIDYCEKKFDFQKLFDVISYSYDVKASKPDPVSFMSILKELKARPEECLFIDDSETNIAASRAMGMPGILFTTAKDLDIELKKILPTYSA